MKNKNNLNLVIITGIFMVISCACPKPDNNSTSNAEPSPAVPSAANKSSTPASVANASANTATSTAGVTLANFNQIKTGMKYDEVVKILGKEGEVISESEVAGYKTVMYKWDGSGGFGANMNAMFQNGKLMSKSQLGLK